MNPIQACPSPREFTDLLLGRLPEPQATIVERHLDDCDRCTQVLADLRVESRILRVLQVKPELQPAVPPGLEELMRQLERLNPADSLPRPIRGEHGAEDFSFLAPAEADGEMGRLGQYRVKRLLGAGGMGYVFLAEDPVLRRQVALKVLRPHVSRDPAAHDRFLREARAMAALKHDHVAALFQVDEAGFPDASSDTPSVPFLAMELLEGERLLEWMGAHPLPPPGWTVRIGRQAADGLAAAHAVGLIHRDVKPANLWLEAPAGWRYDPPLERPSLGEVGRVKLFDFGLALRLGGEWAGGTLLGTPAYMAPEQMRGDAVDARSDLFSLGCVLYELCTGSHPFPNRRLNFTSAKPLPVPLPAGDVNPRIPRVLSALVAQMLAEDPAARPDSARQVERQLKQLELTLTRPSETLPVPAPAVRRVPSRLRWGKWGLLVGGLSFVTTGLLAWPWLAAQSDNPKEPVASVHRPPFPLGPPDDFWCEKLAEASPQQQFTFVARKLEELNPGYNHRVSAGWVEPEAVLRFVVQTDAVRDIRPLRALTDVKLIRLHGSSPGKGKVSDLSPLAALKLKRLYLPNNPDICDLLSIQKMHLDILDLSGTGVKSLTDLAGSSVEQLILDRCEVKNLGPIQTMPRLRVLSCLGCPLESIEPLLGSSVREVRLDFRPRRDTAVLARQTTLSRINGKPRAEFLQAAQQTR